MYTYAKIVKYKGINMHYCLNACNVLRDRQSYYQAKDGACEYLAEGVAEHGLEVFRIERSFPVEVAEQAAPLVDDFSLFACSSPDAHGIMDDNRSKRDGYGKIDSAHSLSESNAGGQGYYPCGVA